MKCKVSKRCGGCTYMEVAYKEQLNQKRKYVQNLFPKYDVEMVRSMEEPYHYRHKVYATFGLDDREKVIAGMYEEKTHKLISIWNCLIQNESANAIINTMVELANEYHIAPYNEDTRKGILRHLYLRVSHADGKVLLVIVIGSKDLPASKKIVAALREKHPCIETIILNYNLDHTNMILGNREKILFGNGFIYDEIGGVRFRISSNSFYQVNPVQTEVLYQTAVDLADLKKTDSVLDACCGIGTISLFASRYVKEVVGVEINEAAIRDAEFNADLNRITNCEFYCDDANTFLDRLIDRPDVVFLDPPRSGMSKNFMDTLAAMKIRKVVYISCNPETQARDLKNLTCKGYRVEKIVPVDMFPFTRHVENIVYLTIDKRQNHIYKSKKKY